MQPGEQQPQTWAEQMDIQDECRISGSGTDVVSSPAQVAEEESLETQITMECTQIKLEDLPSQQVTPATPMAVLPEVPSRREEKKPFHQFIAMLATQVEASLRPTAPVVVMTTPVRTSAAPTIPSVTAGGRTDVPIAAPTPFNGSSAKYQEFIMSMALFMDFNNAVFTDDKCQVGFVLSLMKGGSAGPWVVQKMTTYLATVWPSWKTFEVEL